jgi:NAD(P)H-dependent FMN reductase
MEVVKGVDSAEVELVDLKDYTMPLFADAVEPNDRKGLHENHVVQKWLEKLAEADGFIIITPEYNHSIPSALKNALDYPYKEWNNKPVGYVSYGGLAGGSRAVEHLRQIAAQLQMFDVRAQVSIPNIGSAFDDTGTLSHGESQAKNAVGLVDAVAALASKLRA